MFPALGKLNVIRMWSGIRVMTEDGFPIYDQSQTCPAPSSSAAIPASRWPPTTPRIAPMIGRGALDPDMVGAFSARRFHVQKAA